MSDKRTSLFWGLVLLLAGAFFLLVTTDVLPALTAQTWAILFTVAAVVLLIGYLLTGWRRWYYLFPGAVSAAAAALLWLLEGGVNGSAAAGLFMVIISVPFWIGYLIDARVNRWALIPGWVVAAIGVVVLLEPALSDNMFVSLILLAIASPFLIVFLLDRRQWWALIPAYILGVIGLIFLVTGEDSDLLPVLIVLAIALPFFVVFLLDRRHWWALIPAGVLAVTSLFLLVAIGSRGSDWGSSPVIIGIALALIVVGFWLLLRTLRPRTKNG